jgi:hypothetical protein
VLLRKLKGKHRMSVVLGREINVSMGIVIGLDRATLQRAYVRVIVMHPLQVVAVLKRPTAYSGGSHTDRHIVERPRAQVLYMQTHGRV